MKLNEAREVLYKHGIHTASKKRILRWIENDTLGNWYIVKKHGMWGIEVDTAKCMIIANHKNLLYVLTIALAEYLEA